MRGRVHAVLIVAALSLSADVARAQARRPPLRPPQPPPTQTHPTFTTGARDRRFITVGGAFGLPSGFDTALQPLDFGERASVDTRYSSTVLPGFEIGGGAQVSAAFAVAAVVERLSKAGSGTVSAQVPHPFFFNRSRAVAGDASDLRRTETDLHFQLLWRRPITDRVDAVFGGGPSWMWLRQDVVRDVSVAQTYPYDTATFSGVVTQKDTKGRIGFNAGMTVDYRLAPRLALGVTARYSRARIHFESADSGRVSVDAGGPHVGAGLRFRF